MSNPVCFLHNPPTFSPAPVRFPTRPISSTLPTTRPASCLDSGSICHPRRRSTPQTPPFRPIPSTPSTIRPATSRSATHRDNPPLQPHHLRPASSPPPTKHPVPARFAAHLDSSTRQPPQFRPTPSTPSTIRPANPRCSDLFPRLRRQPAPFLPPATHTPHSNQKSGGRAPAQPPPNPP